MKALYQALAEAAEDPRIVNEIWVKTQVSALKSLYEHEADDEAAHSIADGIHRVVLAAIAAGISWPCTCANEALKTEKIGFQRWCA